MAKDMVYCPDCGAEYNRFSGHTCDPRILEQIAQDERDDQEVRDNGEG
jgi:hypothetical protein